MEPLDPELRGLVAAERAEIEPSAVDRERVARSLAARVGVGLGIGLGLVSSPAAGAVAGGAVAASAGSGLLLKLSLALVVAGAASAVVVPRLTKQSDTPTLQPRSTSSNLAVGSTPTPITEAPAPEAPASPAKPNLSATAQRALPALAEEARLLKQAQQALRAGKPALALGALAEHQRRFPGGQLALERSAARVSALCGLGQKVQAEAEARAFLQQHPGSGLAAQVRASCGFAAPSP